MGAHYWVFGAYFLIVFCIGWYSLRHTSDEADYNLLSALLARTEGAHEVIVTTTDWEHDRLFQSIGVDHVVNPRLTVARSILEIISRGHIGAVVQLSDVDIEAVRFTVEPQSSIAGLPIKKLANKLKKGSIVGVIVREDRMIIKHTDMIEILDILLPG